MKIRLDENISPRVAEAVRALTANRDGYEVSHVRDSHSPGTEDPSWLRKFADEDGTAIVSGDKKILQRWTNLVAYIEAGLIGIFPPPGFGELKGYGRAAFLIRWWPSIVEKLKLSEPGTTWRMPFSWTPDPGKLERLKDPRVDSDEVQEQHGIVSRAKVLPFSRRKGS